MVNTFQRRIISKNLFFIFRFTFKKIHVGACHATSHKQVFLTVVNERRRSLKFCRQNHVAHDYKMKFDLWRAIPESGEHFYPHQNGSERTQADGWWNVVSYLF